MLTAACADAPGARFSIPQGDDMRADPGASAIDGDGEEPEVPKLVPSKPVPLKPVPLKPVPPDDDQLLAVLRRALAARRAVPPP